MENFEKLPPSEGEDTTDKLKGKTTKDILYALEGVPFIGAPICLLNLLVDFKSLTPKQRLLKFGTSTSSGGGQLLLLFDRNNMELGAALCSASWLPYISDQLDRHFIQAPEDAWQRKILVKLVNTIKRK